MNYSHLIVKIKTIIRSVLIDLQPEMRFELVEEGEEEEEKRKEEEEENKKSKMEEKEE